jgi:hypothetical protein
LNSSRRHGHFLKGRNGMRAILEGSLPPFRGVDETLW